MSTTPSAVFLAADQEIRQLLAARRRPLVSKEAEDRTNVLALASNGRIILSGDAAARETRLFSASR
jgi:hypothetical protein